MKGRKPANDEWAGWELTPAEVDTRQALAQPPFWSTWTQERIDSIQELYDAITLYCGGQRARVFDPRRVHRHPGQYLTPEQHAADLRLMKWLDEMHNSGLKRYIQDIVGTIINDDPCRDRGLFKQAVDLHVRVRAKELNRRLRPGKVS